MRLKEILIENYTQQLDTDLDNILVGAKAAGIYNLNPAVVVQNLQKMGYSVDVDSLITLLQDNPVVLNASPDSIRLTGGDTAPDMTDTAEDSEEHVDKLAQTAAQKGLK